LEIVHIEKKEKGAVDFRSSKQKSTAQSATNAKYYASGVGWMRLTQISHLMTKLGIPTIPQVFSDSLSLIANTMNRINSGTAAAHIATEYYLTANMARDGEIDLSYVPTAEALADCFKKPLPKPVFLQQCTTIGMIRNGPDMLGNLISFVYHSGLEQT
jgi:hypothetical protein